MKFLFLGGPLDGQRQHTTGRVVCIPKLRNDSPISTGSGSRAPTLKIERHIYRLKRRCGFGMIAQPGESYYAYEGKQDW